MVERAAPCVSAVRGPASVTLLLPNRRPSFESAYLAAAFAAASAVSGGGSGHLRRVRRCRGLPDGAACLVVGDGVGDGGEAVQYSEIDEVLLVGRELLGVPAQEPDSAYFFDVSKKIRSAADNPVVLGPLVGALSARLRTVVAGLGVSAGPVFFGGAAPSLASDVPLVGALLTSRSWCRRLMDTTLGDLQALEGPLKGRDFMLYWLLCVLDDPCGRRALSACRGEQGGLEALIGGLEDFDATSLPGRIAAALADVRAPPQTVAVGELLTKTQRDELARKQVESERASRPLVEAVRRGDVAAAAALLRGGADIGVRFKSKHHEYGLEHVAAALGVSAPLGVCESGHPAELIAEDLGITLHPPGTGQHHRVNVEMLQTLLGARASLHSVDSDGSTPAFYAAMTGNLQCLQYILEVGGPELFGHKDHLRRTALYWATSNDQGPAVQWMLENVREAFDIDAQSKHGRTALAKAAWSNLPKLATLLLEHRADPRIKDDHGRNVLHMASWGPWGGRRGGKFVNGREAGASPECVELLLKTPEGQECLLIVDRDDATPMHIAASTGAPEVLEVMLRTDAGRKLVEVPPEGASDFLPLAGSAFRGHTDCLQKLLDARADPFRRSARGRSALDFAVAGRQLETASMLVEHASRDRAGADEVATVDLFTSAVEWAIQFGAAPMLKLLLDACPAAVRVKDWVHLCLRDIPDEDVASAHATWPPFPPKPPSWPPETRPEDAALSKPLGPIAVPAAVAAGLPAARECCRVLVEARAAVSEGTLCATLREGVLRGAAGSAIREALVEAFAAGRTPGRSTPQTCFRGMHSAWPLVAAANARDHDAVLLLLAHRADPLAAEGVALATAAAAGNAECAAAIAEAAALGGGDPLAMCRPLALRSGLDRGSAAPAAVVAAAHGHASCVEQLLAVAGRQAAGSLTGLQAACAEAAAATRCMDVARWLESGAGGAAVEAGPLGHRCAVPTVLTYRVAAAAKTRTASRSPGLSPRRSSSDVVLPGSSSWAQLAAQPAAVQGAGREEAWLHFPSSCQWVETAPEALAAVESLRDDVAAASAPALGVDLECHDDVVCTVQISSPRRDVVFDALRLHGILGGALRELFRDPSIVKVFHAPRNDLRWLWLNFGLEVVNLFDTATASRELAVLDPSQRDPSFCPSLKTLCLEHLAIEMDKAYQRADWRLRPLPTEMLSYAAGDSRVLLPLASRLVALLAPTGRLAACREACQKLAACGVARADGHRIAIELLA